MSPQPQRERFEAEAEKAQGNIASEFIEFLRENKKWWLSPIIIVLLLAGLLVLFGASPGGPFIYTLF